MEKLIAWIKDKNNRPVVIGLTAGVLVIIVLLVMIVQRNAASAPTPAVGQPDAQTAAQNPNAAVPNEPAAAQVAAAVPAGTPGVAHVSTIQPMLPYRKDPFVPLQGPVTQKQIIQSLLPSVAQYQSPIGLFPVIPLPGAGIKAEATPEVLPAQPFRRMAGVMIDGRVSAVMETNGESDIVTPGMEITRGSSHVRVESISSDEIVLKTLDTRRPMTIRVGLAGAVTTPPPAQNTAVQQGAGAGAGAIYPAGGRMRDR